MRTKKKGFSFKRAVSLLLAMAMVLTAAPQASMTALAAEPGDNTDVTADAEVLTTEDVTPTESDDAVTQEEDDDDDVITDDVPSDDETGDSTESGSDEQPADPDDAEQSESVGGGTEEPADPDDMNQDGSDEEAGNPDDADLPDNGGDAGESDEAAEPEVDEDENLTTDDESISENDLGREVMEDGDPVEEYDGWSGEIDEGDNRLILNEWAYEDWKDGDGKENPVASFEEAVKAVLKYYSEKRTFDHVQFDINNEFADNSKATIKAEYINGSLSILNSGGDVSYNVTFNDDINNSYSLSHPKELSNDLEITYDVDTVANQGVKINLSIGGDSSLDDLRKLADGIYVSWNKSGEGWDDKAGEYLIDDYIWRAERQDWDDVDLRLVLLTDDSPSGIVESDAIEYSVEDYGTHIGLSLFEVMNPELGENKFELDKDYLITSLYYDEESVPVGSEGKELTAGLRIGTSDGITVVTWESLSGDIITFTPNNEATATVTVTANEVGEAYYSVSYKVDSSTYLELHSVRAAIETGSGVKLSYIGEVSTDEGSDASRLRINEQKSIELNGEDVDITDILEYYAEKNEKFNCVELSMIDLTPASRKMKKEYINGARAIMADVDNKGCWMDYNFRDDDANTEVRFTLGSPYEATADIPAAFTFTNLDNQGLKVKFTSTAFPADYVSMECEQPGTTYDSSLRLNDEGRVELGLFTHSSGTPTALIRMGDEWESYFEAGDGGEDSRFRIRFNNIKLLTGNKEYLAVSIYDDEEKPVVGDNDKPTQLKAGTRAGVTNQEQLKSVTWKSLDTDLATIDSKGQLTAWSDEDAIYYYVKYKNTDNKQYLEVHKIYAVRSEVNIKFDKDEVNLKYYPEGSVEGNAEEYYLQLRFYPSNVDRNDQRMRWDIIEEHPAASAGTGEEDDQIDLQDDDQDESGTPKVVSLITDDDGVERGGIIAEGEGNATVRVTYYYGDGEYDEDGNFIPGKYEDGEFIPDEDKDIFTPDDGTSPIITATYNVTVIAPLTWNYMREEVKVDDLNEKLYAVMGADTTLGAVQFPEEFNVDGGKWAWKEPDTKLADYQGMDGNQFAAIYTVDENHTFEYRPWVRFITPTGITMMTKNDEYEADSEDENKKGEWFEYYVPESLKIGDSATLGYHFEVDGIDPNSEDEYEQAKYQEAITKLNTTYADKVEWTASPAAAGKENKDDHTFTFTAASAKAPEKQTVTVSIKDGKKVLFKDTKTITVTKEDPWDLDDIVDGPWKEKDKDTDYLVFKVWGKSEEECKKLTTVSEDTNILKLDTKKIEYDPTKEKRDGNGEDEDVIYVRIPFTQPKLQYGTAWIKVTAPDEIKSTKRYHIEFIDAQPKVISTTTITFNKQMIAPEADVTLRTHGNCTITKSGLLLDENPTTALKMEMLDGPTQEEVNGDKYNDYSIKLTVDKKAFADVKKGKHTVTLELEVQVKEQKDEETAPTETQSYSVPLTLNVTDAVPKVTFKQTKKFNHFYTDREGYGILTVTAADAEVTGLELIDPEGSGICNFKLEKIQIFDEDSEGEEGETEPQYETNVYFIALREEVNAADYTKNKKGLLRYKLDGYGDDWREVGFTVAVENKKPTIVLSSKSHTLYPAVGYTDAPWMYVYDKATGEGIDTDGIEVFYKVNKIASVPVNVISGEDWENNSEKIITVTANNNSYELAVIDSHIVTRLQTGTYKNKTDKFNLSIQAKNWAEPVTVSYSCKVDTGIPKLVLGKSTLTLNKHDKVYQAQQARTTLRFKGYDAPVWSDGYWNKVTFAGADDKSKQVLSGKNCSLTLDYWHDDPGNGEVVVRFNNNELATGTYKFKVNAYSRDRGVYSSTTLTIKVVEKDPTKGLKVTAKGAINLMDREGTYITYTPKLTDLAGEVDWGGLEGKDADLFETMWEDGKMYVRAWPYTNYSTKQTYEVQAVFHVQTPDYGGYEVRTDAAKPLKIKVKQGKPKLTATAINNTIYRQLNNSAEIKLSAVFNKKEVEIDHVELLNYTQDFELEWAERTRGEDETYWSSYNPQTGSVKLSLRNRYEADSVVKNGNTWKVKLKVVYREKAGNEKAAEITCPIIVR